MKNTSGLPLVLCILDGWGHAPDSATNAIGLAHTPTWDRWSKTYPFLFLDASGTAVGLPPGQMGNSEVGHTTIGTGRVVLQDLPRLHKAFEEGEIEKHAHIHHLITLLKKSGKACHLMGLFSPGGVHSHQDHILGFIEILGRAGIPVHLHLFLDGRDTPPKSSTEYLSQLTVFLKNYPTVRVATLMGRFYAMDRDHRWDRTQKAYLAMVGAEGQNIIDLEKALTDFYAQGITDEFIPPVIMPGYRGFQENDALIMANFRADRVRQILEALVAPQFQDFPRGNPPLLSVAMGMKAYSEKLSAHLKILFPPTVLKNTLGEVLSHNHFTQLRIAETEKYAHVTFFFNGGQEHPLPGENRILIPSPKVSTYDEKPDMSAREITETLLQVLKEQKTDVIIVNYANTDMVGHTGKLTPTIKAVETVDACLAQLEEAVLKNGGTLMVTADHGNAEQMTDGHTHQPHTAHTTNLVPFVCITQHTYSVNKTQGELKDVAPTILTFLGLNPPSEMQGHSLMTRKT
ncbi:MAG: 2,3-bisphosphoglycerate-independent phosphoglycerate mutase [Alphaproteobacteria bacterium]